MDVEEIKRTTHPVLITHPATSTCKHCMPNHMSGQLLRTLTRSDYVQQYWNNLSAVLCELLKYSTGQKL